MRRMETWVPAAVLLATWVGFGCGPATRHRELEHTVRIDGRFDEWRGISPLIEDDPTDAPLGSAVDLGIVLATDDPRWLYLAIDVGDTVNAQAMRGTLQIVLDGDGDPSTGAVFAGMGGVDAAVELSPTDPQRPSVVGMGVLIRTAHQSGEERQEPLGARQPGDFAGIVVAPTHSGSRFEIRIGRGDRLDLPTRLLTGDSVRIKLRFLDQGGVRDETDVAHYGFEHRPGGGAPGAPVSAIQRSAGAFRVLQWNVADQRFRERPDAFVRVIAALTPDVVLLDEVYGSVTSDDLTRFFARPGMAQLGPWQFVVGRSGGRQKAVVASREPVRPAPEMVDIRYPADSLERLDEAIADARFSQLLSAERERGLATVGAWVRLSGREVFFVSLDLQSAGYHGSPRDRLRELQAFTIRSHILSAVGPIAAPIVVGGDLNLVGSARPLEVLRSGLDVDGSTLTPADTYRLGDAALVTWRSVLPNPFTAGRLDFILYADAVLEPVRSFAFDADGLPVALLDELGLEPADSRITSDHLPLVADFRWK